MPVSLPTTRLSRHELSVFNLPPIRGDNSSFLTSFDVSLVTIFVFFFFSLLFPQFFAVLLIAFAVVMALPHDESVVGGISDAENFRPENPQEILKKLKKFKKLFLG